MPSNHDGVWRSYTNVIMANGVLMMPVYPDVDADLAGRALDVYRRLLPRWQIVPVDSSALIHCGGALHCISNQLQSLAGWRQIEPAMPLIHRAKRTEDGPPATPPLLFNADDPTAGPRPRSPADPAS
jgi:hypothetical protein